MTLTRVALDDRENRRRIEDERRRDELRDAIAAESVESAAANADVAARWGDLFGEETPQALRDALDEQRRRCDAIVASKVAIADRLRAELEAKDEAYVETLKKQAEDVDELLLRMGRQFREMRAASLAELEEIERAFLERRAETLAANAAEIDALFERRAKSEQAFMEHMAERSEHYADELEKHRVDDAEEYNILKIRLETDVQNLEQHLGAMRATYQLNTEKLEYNYRVLVERDHENQSTMTQQRKKIAKQREALMNLKARYAETEKKLRSENVKLGDDHRRATEAFKDLQIKCRHFEQTDTRKYREVWEMNRELVAEKVRRVLDADRVLHEQQLGLAWRAPSDDVFLPPEALALEAARKKRAAVASAAAAAAAAAGEEEDADEAAAAPSPGAGDEDPEDENPFARRVADPAYADVLARLAEETDFLIDANARRVLEAAEEEARAAEDPAELDTFRAASARLKAETVLRALGVSDAPAFDGLMAALVVDGADAAAEAAAKRNVVDVMVPPDDIVGRLVRFAESERRSGDGKARALAALKAAAAVDDAEGGGDAPAPRKTKEELESEYWDRMANVVGPRTYRAWGALENGLVEYHALLRRRRDALECESAGGAKRRTPRAAQPVPQLQDQRRAAGAPDGDHLAGGRGRSRLLRISITRGSCSASLLSRVASDGRVVPASALRLVDASSMRHAAHIS